MRKQQSSTKSDEQITDMCSLNQHEFESAVYKILAFGDETELAKAAGKSPAYYSQMLNPHDPRESTWYKAARDMKNLLDLDPERGLQVLDLFNYFVRRDLPGDDSLCLEKTRAKAFKESSEAHLAEASDEEIDTIVREYEESGRAAYDHAEAWRAEKRRRTKAGIGDSVLRKFEANGRAR